MAVKLTPSSVTDNCITATSAMPVMQTLLRTPVWHLFFMWIVARAAVFYHIYTLYRACGCFADWRARCTLRDPVSAG